jgi:hypothetical protein
MVHSGPNELLDPIIGTFYTKVLHICRLTPLREREREREREHIPRVLLEAPSSSRTTMIYPFLNNVENRERLMFSVSFVKVLAGW